MRQHTFILVVGGLVLCSGRLIGGNEQLTATNLVSVRPGMTMEQVKSVLGQPISEYKQEYRRIYCPCNPEHTCYNVKRHTLVYTEKSLVPPYPMVWVHFNDREKVHEVFVNRYTFNDHRAIHVVTQNPCDSTDAIVPLSKADTAAISALTEFFELN